MQIDGIRELFSQVTLLHYLSSSTIRRLIIWRNAAAMAASIINGYSGEPICVRIGFRLALETIHPFPIQAYFQPSPRAYDNFNGGNHIRH